MSPNPVTLPCLAEENLDLGKDGDTETGDTCLEQGLAKAVLAAENAEYGLAIADAEGNLVERLATGSFYTPADVAEHFWREYFRFHGVSTSKEAARHLAEVQFVEPAVGAGMFLFSLLKGLADLGCSMQELSSLRFAAADINDAALAFVSRQVSQIESRCGLRLSGLTLRRTDFRAFSLSQHMRLSFVGNPPYVREGTHATWRNLYAAFLDRMISVPSDQVSIGLVLPLSIAFSRDYAFLREKVRRWSHAIRLANFDNIPDCLFKAGKPGSLNTNKANSQRCSVVFLRNHGPCSMDSTDLQRWSKRERSSFLRAMPPYHDISAYAFDGQFPRPSCDWIMDYLRGSDEADRLGDLVGQGQFGFAVVPVARNFIGIRDLSSPEVSSPLIFPTEQRMLWALQILASPAFYEYWRTVGDGFHVTRSDIERFPVTRRLLRGCAVHEPRARIIWSRKDSSLRQKLNSGKEVCSFDFRGQFDYLSEYVSGHDDAGIGEVLPDFPRRAIQPSFLDFPLPPRSGTEARTLK